MTVLSQIDSITSPNNMAPISDQYRNKDPDVVALPKIKTWWRATADRVSGTGNGTQTSGASFVWLDSLGGGTTGEGIPLVPASDTGPQLLTGGQGGRSFIKFNDSGRTGRLIGPVDMPLWVPGQDMTIFYVMRPVEASSTAYLGTDLASGFANISHNSGGTNSVQHVNPTNLFTSSAVSATIPHIGVYSYRAADHTFAYYVNGVLDRSGTAPVEVAAGRFTVGNAGSAATLSNRGDCYAVGTIEAAYHDPLYVTALQTLNEHLLDYYDL